MKAGKGQRLGTSEEGTVEAVHQGAEPLATMTKGIWNSFKVTSLVLREVKNQTRPFMK
jgi:hypothetical protein